MAESKNKAMRDIRSDLQDRADWIRQQIRAQQANFELVTAQLKRDQTNQLENLRAQLEAVTRLLRLATWYHDVRMATARSLALAATAEIAAREFSLAQDRSATDRPSESHAMPEVRSGSSVDVASQIRA